MRATAARTRRHHGLAAVGALIVMVASMSPAFAGAGAGPSTTTAPNSTSTSSTSTSSTTLPPTTADPVYYGVSTTLGVVDPADFLPSSTTTTPPPTVVMTMHATITTTVTYDFDGRGPGPEESVEEPSSTVGAERVVFRGPGTTEPPGASATTTEPVRPVSRAQDSATLAAVTSANTESGVSLFWPVILGVCCLLLLGGPVVARRLRHPH